MTHLKTSRGALRRAVVASLSALWLTASAQSAFAGPPTETKSVRVFFGDLDLSKDAGAQTLYRRLQQAARNVCGPYYQPYPIGGSWRQCYERSLAEAVEKINRPQLAALHAKSTKASS